MRIISCVFVALSLLIVINSCSSYEPQAYGPIEFEITIEGPIFEGSVADGIVSIPFNPENFGITREDIYSMKMKEMSIETDHESGIGIFENIKFTVMTDDTETKEIASSTIESGAQKITIEGLNEAEIKGFSKINNFFLEVDCISREEIFDDITIKGSFIMHVMVPEKK